jgi:hypothetical protein
MILRSFLAGIVVAALLFPGPGWAAAIVGSAGPSTAATVRGVGLRQGSNVFSGDVLEVGPGGSGVLTFGHNAMVRFGEETAAQLSREPGTVALQLLRGRMVFRSTPGQLVEGRVGDAVVRPEKAQEVIASLAYRNPKLVVVAAQRGTLLVATAHDGRTVTVPQGEMVEVALDDTVPPKPPTAAGNAPPPPPPSNGPSGKKWGTWVVLGGGAVLITGLVLAEQDETFCPPNVSPSTFPCP